MSQLLIWAPRGSGGAYTHLGYALPGLCRLASGAGVEVKVFASAHATQRVPSLRDLGAYVVPCDTYSERASWEFQTLPRFLRDPAAVVFAPFGPLLNLACAPRAIWMSRNIIPLLPPSDWEIGPREHVRHHFLRFLFAMSARVSAGVICVSDHARALLSQLSGRQAAAIDVVPHGCSLDGPEPSPDSAVHSLLARPFLLSTGSWIRYRRVDEVFKALSLLLARGVAVPHLVHVGDMDESDPLHARGCRALASPLVAAGHLTILPTLRRPDVIALTKRAVAVVYPSVHEDCPNFVREAMLAGRPLICADIPANREASPDGALFVRDPRADGLATAIHRLLEDPALGRALGARGHRSMAGRTWDAAIEQTWAAIRRRASSLTSPSGGVAWPAGA